MPSPRKLAVFAPLLGAVATACARTPARVPFSFQTVSCAEAGDHREIVLRGAAEVGDTIVAVGEAHGAFQLAGQRVRCPTSPATVVLGRARSGEIRFGSCIDSIDAFPKLVPLEDGFYVVDKTARGAMPEPMVDASATSPERALTGSSDFELASFRFDGQGRVVARATLVGGRALLNDATAMPDGSLVAETTTLPDPTHLEPAPEERRLLRVSRGAPRSIGAPEPTTLRVGFIAPVNLVALDATTFVRVHVIARTLVVEALDAESGAARWSVREPLTGDVIDLGCTRGPNGVWIALSTRDESNGGRWERRLLRVADGRVVARRSLGHEDLNAHVYGVVARERGAAVLFEIWPNAGQPTVFEGERLTEKGNVAVVAFDDDRAPALLAFFRGDDVTALDFAASRQSLLVAGWYRGRLDAVPASDARCAAFVALAPRE